MAANSKIIKLDVPSGGMNTMSFKAIVQKRAKVLCGMMITDDERAKRCPGNTRYNTGFEFDSTDFFGIWPYKDAAFVERKIAINNGQIVEFNGNEKTNRLAVNATRHFGFLNAQNACFAWNGIDNYKGYGASWGKWGLKGPEIGPTLTQGTGGSLADGTYLVAVSYVVKEGDSRVLVTASEFGSKSITIASGSGTAKIVVSNLGTPPSKFTHKIIWCTALNGSVLYEHSEVAASVSSVDITTAPTSGVEYETYENNYGINGIVKWANFNNNSLWIIDSTAEDSLQKSNSGLHWDFESFPLSNVVKFPKKLTFCTSLSGVQFAFAKDAVWKLSNSSVNDDPVLVSGSIGTDAPWSWAYYRDGMIGITNRGVEFFDGFKFWNISTEISELVKKHLYKSEEQGILSRGIIHEDREFGSCYYVSANIQSDFTDNLDEIKDYLPGGIPLGTGLGSPSDDFKDNSLSSTRWEEESGNATITEQNQRLEVAKTDASVEEVCVKSKATFGQPLLATVKATITANTGTDHEIIQYVSLEYDADNYAMIGFFRSDSESKIVSRICIAGTVEENEAEVTADTTTFRVRIRNGRAETMYKTALGAWEFLGVMDTPNWNETGWSAKLGLLCEVAGAAPTFGGYFQDFRMQCYSVVNLETITPESFATNKANCSLVAQVGTWKPDIFDKDGVEKQPIWSINPNRAQQFMVTENGEFLFSDYYKGGIYQQSNDDASFDGEMIPCAIVMFPFDGGSGRLQKYCNQVIVTGNWEDYLTVKLVSWPTKQGQEKILAGFNRTNVFGTPAIAGKTTIPAVSIWKEAKFKKILGNAVQLIITKLDFDSQFVIEKIEPKLTIVRDR
jgi:hypothetical protein